MWATIAANFQAIFPYLGVLLALTFPVGGMEFFGDFFIGQIAQEFDSPLGLGFWLATTAGKEKNCAQG